MISLEDALERILGTVHVLEPVVEPILDCLGQVLATDLVAGIDIPPHNNSAMDGLPLSPPTRTPPASNNLCTLK